MAKKGTSKAEKTVQDTKKKAASANASTDKRKRRDRGEKY